MPFVTSPQGKWLIKKTRLRVALLRGKNLHRLEQYENKERFEDGRKGRKWSSYQCPNSYEISIGYWWHQETRTLYNIRFVLIVLQVSTVKEESTWKLKRDCDARISELLVRQATLVMSICNQHFWKLHKPWYSGKKGSSIATQPFFSRQLNTHAACVPLFSYNCNSHRNLIVPPLPSCSKWPLHSETHPRSHPYEVVCSAAVQIERGVARAEVGVLPQFPCAAQFLLNGVEVALDGGSRRWRTARRFRRGRWLRLASRRRVSTSGHWERIQLKTRNGGNFRAELRSTKCFEALKNHDYSAVMAAPIAWHAESLRGWGTSTTFWGEAPWRHHCV